MKLSNTLKLVGSLGACASCAAAGPTAPTHAYIIEGSGFFGAPGIELASIGRVNLSDPSDVETFPIAGDFLRFGGADTAGDGLIAFENTTNSLRVIDPSIGGNTLVDSIGYMDSGVAHDELTACYRSVNRWKHIGRLHRIHGFWCRRVVAWQ